MTENSNENSSERKNPLEGIEGLENIGFLDDEFNTIACHRIFMGGRWMNVKEKIEESIDKHLADDDDERREQMKFVALSVMKDIFAFGMFTSLYNAKTVLLYMDDHPEHQQQVQEYLLGLEHSIRQYLDSQRERLNRLFNLN